MASSAEGNLKPDQLSGQGLPRPSPTYFGGLTYTTAPRVPVTFWVDIEAQALKPKPVRPTRPTDSGFRWTKRRIIGALVALTLAAGAVLFMGLLASEVIDHNKIWPKEDSHGPK